MPICINCTTCRTGDVRIEWLWSYFILCVCVYFTVYTFACVRWLCLCVPVCLCALRGRLPTQRTRTSSSGSERRLRGSASPLMLQLRTLSRKNWSTDWRWVIGGALSSSWRLTFIRITLLTGNHVTRTSFSPIVSLLSYKHRWSVVEITAEFRHEARMWIMKCFTGHL